MLNELQLLNGIEDKIQEEQLAVQPLKEMKHSLTVTITKGRKFKQLIELERPASFYFALSGFKQKVRSSSYPTS